MGSTAPDQAARPGGVGPPVAASPGAVPAAGGVVHLLGQFQVSHLGVPVELPASTHRLVAFLALQGHRVERSYAASCLWLDKSGDRAGANLRSTLWRLRRCPVQLVTAAAGHVGLREDVAVDTAGLLRCARDLVDERRVVDLDAVEIGDLSVDLLPSWYDDFVEVERERFRQLRLHALEALSRRLRAEGRYARALDAALAAVSADSLRESAHRAVIQVHLDEGNTAEAVRQYRLLSEVLRVHLGIEPSRRSRELIGEQLRDGHVGPPVRYSAEPGYRPAELRDSPRAQPRRPRIALA